MSLDDDEPFISSVDRLTKADPRREALKKQIQEHVGAEHISEKTGQSLDDLKRDLLAKEQTDASQEELEGAFGTKSHSMMEQASDVDVMDTPTAEEVLENQQDHQRQLDQSIEAQSQIN